MEGGRATGTDDTDGIAYQPVAGNLPVRKISTVKKPTEKIDQNHKGESHTSCYYWRDERINSLSTVARLIWDAVL
jgi:hypothetical protein